MSQHSLSSLILKLQHHEQSLHGIEHELINQVEQAELAGPLRGPLVEALVSAVKQSHEVRSQLHHSLSALCDQLLSTRGRAREERQARTPAPFQTSTGNDPAESSAYEPLMQGESGSLEHGTAELLPLDETPALHTAAQDDDFIDEAPTLEPQLQPLTLSQPSPKLQEALSAGSTSLDDRLPSPGLAPKLAQVLSSNLDVSSPQPEVLPPLMNTPLPIGMHEYSPLPSRSEAETRPFSEEVEPLSTQSSNPALEVPALEATPEPAPYITYVPPTPEPVKPQAHDANPRPHEPIVKADDLSLDDLDFSLDQVESALSAALPSLGAGSSRAQEEVAQRAPRVALGVRVMVSTEVVRFEAMGHDISEGGIFIETDTPLEPGEYLSLSFELDRSAFVVKVKAQVRWCRLPRDASESKPVGAGLRFIDLSEQASAEIIAFTSERLGAGI
jgi:uncharacterized protein (TIGR02266 family)